MRQSGGVGEAFAGIAGLGIAGFDPLGALALMAAMALGARRRAIATLLVTTVATIVVTGFVLSSTVGTWAIAQIHRLHDPGHIVWGLIVLAAGVGLLAWAIVRLVRVPQPKPDDATRSGHSVGMLAVIGIGVGLSAFIDPAFYGLLVVAGGIHSWPMRLGGIVLWACLSQIALLALSGAVFAGAFAPVHRFITRVRQQWGARASRFASWALLVIAVIICVEGAFELHGHWWIP
ncbi:Hypothetical protein PFR_JS2_1793 [Propionibacterium freudenreichii]|nr:Hypothetical protein PFR_JS2_1793 [Propionibacterium freudenreichii]